jgi:cellobiose-specific phosphotransferase system component IIA
MVSKGRGRYVMNPGRLAVLLGLAILAGCGMDSMSAAATSAAARKQELEQSQKALQRARQQIDQAVKAQEERLRAQE